MSLAKQVRKLNLESENTSFIDEEVVVPSIEEQLEAEEAEAELVEVLDEVEENQDALEESEEVESEIDDHIAEAEATVAEAEGAVGDAGAEAEGPAAEEGETPAEASEDTDAGEVAPEEVADADAPESVLDENGELPVEEVVAAQEALQNLLKRTGYTLPNRITVSREDVRSNPLEAYKMNLEDWKELKTKVADGAKKIWEAIKKAFVWIGEQIAKVWPTKEKKLKALLQEVSKVNVTKEALEAASKDFIAKNAERFGGVGALAKTPDDVARFTKLIKLVGDAVITGTKAKDMDEVNAFIDKVLKADVNFSYAPLKEALTTGEGGQVVSIKTSGNTITVGYVLGGSKEIEGDKLNGLVLSKEVAAGYIAKFLAMNNTISATMKQASAAIDALKEDKIGFFQRGKLKYAVNGVIKTYTGYNNNLTQFILAYGNAVLKAASKSEAPKAE